MRASSRPRIDAFLGLDVGKGEHHATAVSPAGKEAFDKFRRGCHLLQLARSLVGFDACAPNPGVLGRPL
ncbi:hypothetical protein PWJ43_32820 [Streptomyces sp. BE230]|nr:hypothetical protein [Streptomyces sp. BE230]